MGAGAGTAGDVFSGTMPAIKDKVLVIGTVTAKGNGYEFLVEEVRRGDDVLLTRGK